MCQYLPTKDNTFSKSPKEIRTTSIIFLEKDEEIILID
jgi:hypothetical protein